MKKGRGMPWNNSWKKHDHHKHALYVYLQNPTIPTTGFGLWSILLWLSNEQNSACKPVSSRQAHFIHTSMNANFPTETLPWHKPKLLIKLMCLMNNENKVHITKTKVIYHHKNYDAKLRKVTDSDSELDWPKKKNLVSKYGKEINHRECQCQHQKTLQAKQEVMADCIKTTFRRKTMGWNILIR